MIGKAPIDVMLDAVEWKAATPPKRITLPRITTERPTKREMLALRQAARGLEMAAESEDREWVKIKMLNEAVILRTLHARLCQRWMTLKVRGF